MKTKILVFTALLIGGLIFTSCKKDNELLNDNSYALNDAKTTSDTPDTVWVDIMTNYPDPFYGSTTIEYRLDRMTWVKLSVYSENSGFGTILVHEIQEKGIHTYNFGAAGLEPGDYIAELKINNKIVKEVMTKKEVPTYTDDPNPAADE